MIQNDGTLVFYFDDKGAKIAASQNQGKPYIDLLTIQGAQIGAVLENFHALEKYNNALANAQLNVDAGRPVDAPLKPLMHTVSDTGVEAFGPFVPPLADLIPAPVPPAPTPGAFKVGPRIDGSMFECLPGDTTKALESGVAKSADGVVGVFKKAGGLFGAGTFYYLLIKEMVG